MTKQTSSYGFSVTVPLPYEQAVERTREELALEGFGILTEIDVSATLKKKLDVEFRPYVILGACNPSLANLALSRELDVGLLLPCNVIVYATDQEGRTAIRALDPVRALSLSDNPEIRPVAEEARARLKRALQAAAT